MIILKIHLLPWYRYKKYRDQSVEPLRKSYMLLIFLMGTATHNIYLLVQVPNESLITCTCHVLYLHLYLPGTCTTYAVHTSAPYILLQVY